MKTPFDDTKNNNFRVANGVDDRIMFKDLGLHYAPWLANLRSRMTSEVKFNAFRKIGLRPVTAALLMECRKYEFLKPDYFACIAMLREAGFYKNEVGL